MVDAAPRPEDESTVLAKPDVVPPASDAEAAVPFPSEVMEKALRLKVQIQQALRKLTKDLKSTESRLYTCSFAMTNTTSVSFTYSSFAASTTTSSS